MEAVFLKLLNMSLTASILAAVVMLLRLWLKKAPRWIHCLLWAMVALRLILPFSFESPTSLIRDTHVITNNTFLFADDPAESELHAVSDPDTLVFLQQNNQQTPSPVPEKAGMELTGILTLVWVAGMAVMAAYSLLSYLRLRRQVAPSLALTENIYLCDYIDTPFILGMIRPRIYLPTSMHPSAAAHVLAHERAHIHRLDHWWKPLGFVLLTVHWFNPVIWVAYILLCRDIELACDEKVIKEMGCADKLAYSEALLRCSIPRRMIAACPLAFGEVGVKERVKNVVNFKKPTIWIILAAVVICIAVAACFLTDPMDDADNTTLAELQSVSDDDVLSVTLSYISIYMLDAQHGQMQEQSRFLYQGHIDRVTDFLETARIDPEPVSQDRSEDRSKHYGITLQNGSTELSYWFDSEFSEVWIDDGVKPSYSYRMEDPEAARTLFQSMLTESSAPALPIQGSTFIASGSQSTAFDGTVLDVNKDYMDVSTGMLYDGSDQITVSSSHEKVVRVYWHESNMQFLPGDEVHILGYSISDDPLETPVFRAYSIQLLKPILPASIHMEIARELGTTNFTCFDAVRAYQHTDSRLKTSFVVGIRYGDRYALGYYSNDSDGAVFERLVTEDQLEPTGIDGVFRVPDGQTNEYSIYLRTKQIRYYMVPRYDADGVGQLHITDNQPAIHIRYANEGSISNHFSYGHNVVYEIFPQYVSYSEKWSGISLALPESWEYEIREPETENGRFSIAFRPAGADGWVVVQYTPDSFVPVGETQKTEALPASSYRYGATMAYCDNSDDWSYIQFHAPYDNYAVVNEGADWLAIYYGDTALRILRTLTLT